MSQLLSICESSGAGEILKNPNIEEIIKCLNSFGTGV